ncbi:putative AbiEi antitoxin of type IV toxin-antitoxin system [Humibacillus xanthopallidus]|uniref:Putative AbiEi antitoxin of type IV toxin-antitoxin system n=1 Tax=Humibacillus xanthopallidus TaxID=412689 RepID=A0A543PR77_9MICO|nr:type IV toxin-antitoxin system AbiEi family antitoxin domain-containing protein [Humibacillus xanthopallidus]TQN46579.1 putative AbiEi antitoxin of type IV toxin-antitoxin system [Humibacillus xanthopallidus]
MSQELGSFARAHFGLITRQRALASGLTDAAIRWRVGSGRWVQLHRGVYQTMPGRDDWLTRAQAALLHVGTPSALCGPSAGFLWRILPTPGPRLHIVVPATRRPTSTGDLVVTRSRHATERMDEREWPHRVNLDHTVFDLAQGASLDTAVALIAKACQTGRTTVHNLRLTLLSRPNQTHRSDLSEALSDIGAGAESSAERRYLRDVERAHGLPVAARQAPGPGGTVCDNDYEEQRLKVEVDGRLGHAGWIAQQKDGRRDRTNATREWLTVRVHWPDVAGTPCDTARDLALILQQRGWEGAAHPCRRADCVLSAD